MWNDAVMLRRARRALAMVLVGMGCSTLVACGGKGEQPPVVSAPPVDLTAKRVERGKYLVTILACNDCHTPWKMGEHGPEPDMSRMLSGHPQELGELPRPTEAQEPWIWSGAATNTAYAGPWGITYAINLTPDNHTGLGIWTEEMFIKALRTGKHFGEARPIMPPMPWPAFGQMTDEDLKSVYAYLRSIPPIQNMVPDYQPPPKPPRSASAK